MRNLCKQSFPNKELEKYFFFFFLINLENIYFSLWVFSLWTWNLGKLKPHFWEQNWEKRYFKCSFRNERPKCELGQRFAKTYLFPKTFLSTTRADLSFCLIFQSDWYIESCDMRLLEEIEIYFITSQFWVKFFRMLTYHFPV